jgi:chromosome segregation ATPase
MADTNPEMTLDDAANAVGQMENFFKAFRRVSDVVRFLQTAEGRKKELTGAISGLEDALADAGREHTEKLTAMKAEHEAEQKKVDKAKVVLKQIEAEAAEKTVEAEASVERIKANATQAAEEARAAQAAADAHLAETLAEAEEAEARVVKAKEALAAMMAAGG